MDSEKEAAQGTTEVMQGGGFTAGRMWVSRRMSAFEATDLVEFSDWKGVCRALAERRWKHHV